MRGELGIDQALGLVDRPRRPQRDDDPERPGELAARLIGGHVLGDLFLDHELAMKAARSAASQDVAQQQQGRVVVVKWGTVGQIR